MSDSPPSQDADHAAMLALADGHDSALNDIMARWRGGIIAFLYRLTGCHETALDLTQETFVRVYTARHRYDARGKFSTWLFSIATNLARNHARWRSRHPEVALPEDDSRLDTAPAPDDAAVSREQLAAVQQAIAALPGDLREALVLSVYHEMPHAEIAAILGCSIKAVELRIYRARQQLREKLERQA